MSKTHQQFEETIRLMHCDLNWAADPWQRAATPQDWAFVDPQEYFDWHREFGTNVMYCQAFLFGGTALYPTKLGPLAPGPGSQLFPKLYEIARREGFPVWSYFCVGADLVMSNHRSDWVVPGSRKDWHPYGFLAPESGWTELLCARIREFLSMYPVDWLLLDWFVYGGPKPNEELVQPADYAKEAFRRIIGRKMPDTADAITAEEHLHYKRTVLAEQFYQLRDAVLETNPTTKILFNVPYHEAGEALWVDHPMMIESDGLFAECNKGEVMEWLLKVRAPHQRVMTTIIGRVEPGECEPTDWKRWYDAGCDFFGYVHASPPDFRPPKSKEAEVATVREAFDVMRGLERGAGK
jgi:hypothetical protein